MPTSGGIYFLIPSYRAVAGQTIRTEQHNPVLEDIAQALTDRLPRNGTAPMTGNLPMSGNRITGLANGIADTDAATMGQIVPYNVTLEQIAAQVITAGSMLYAVDSVTWGVTSVTAFGRSLLDDADAAAARTTLGVAEVIDEDDMASNSATRPPSQQSVKTYVDEGALGRGQLWRDMTPERALSTIYQNTSGRPIQVSVTARNTAGGGSISFLASDDNSTWVTAGYSTVNGTMNFNHIIPAGHYYRVLPSGGSPSIEYWAELRAPA